MYKNIRYIIRMGKWVCSPACPYPRYLHVTKASVLSQPLLHTLPHTPLMQTSTRPSWSMSPSTRWIAPSSHCCCSVYQKRRTCSNNHTFCNLLRYMYLSCISSQYKDLHVHTCICVHSMIILYEACKWVLTLHFVVPVLYMYTMLLLVQTMQPCLEWILNHYIIRPVNPSKC